MGNPAVLLVLALSLASGCAVASVKAEPDHLTVNVFPGGFNWPLFVARDKGMLAARNLVVDVELTTGSVAQMSGLAAGKFDIAMTAIDNVVAYVEGEGDRSVGRQTDFVAVMGSDSGFLSLVADPTIASTAQLRGKTLSVDALSTGYAFVLFDMIARSGLEKGSYAIVPVGGMIQRWTAMRDKKQAATLLSTPYDILAKARGFHQLAWATDVIGPYQGNVAATRRGWARTHRAQIVSFIRAYAAAIDWLYAPEHRAEAIAILHANVPAMTPQLAGETYAELLAPKGGFYRNAEVSDAGLATVLRLRSAYGGSAELGASSRYYDSSFWQEAMHDDAH